MKELDQLLNRWLAQHWAASSEAQRGVFLQLLDCEDDRLWRWFLGHENAPDAALDALVQRIRALPPAGCRVGLQARPARFAAAGRPAVGAMASASWRDSVCAD